MDFTNITSDKYPELNDKLGFGKYKGNTIREVLNKDISYIVWCINNVMYFNLSDGFKDAILEEYTKMNQYGWHDDDSEEYGFSPAYIDGEWFY